MNTSLLSPTASPQMGTNAFFRHCGIHIVAGVEDILLNIAEDVLRRIILGTAFGQTDPVQLQLAHRPTCLPGFTRMCRILV